MDLRDYFMDEIWPNLTDEQRQELVEIASVLAKYAPTQETGTTDEETDKND